MSNLKISLLIPTLNAGTAWLETLQSIDDQIYPITKKIIVDSGSSDDTIKLAKQFGFDINEIDKKEFNHGKTRQQLVEFSGDVDVCVFLTQDAILASQASIANIIKAFDDSTVGMAYGRQLPHLNAKVLETHARLYNYPAESHTRSYSDKDQFGFKIFFCSNSFAAYRRTSLLAVGGFPTDSIMGEDAILAAKMLSAGFKKTYEASASVYHSHSYTLMEEFKRYFDTRVFHEQNRWLIKTFGKPTGEGLRFMKSELMYVLKNDWTFFFKSVFSLGVKWLGYKTGSLYKKIPISVLKKASMHKSYWH